MLTFECAVTCYRTLFIMSDIKYNDKDNDKDNDEDKDILRTPPKSNPRDLGPKRHLFRVMRRHDMTKKIDKEKYILRTTPKSNPRDL